MAYSGYELKVKAAIEERIALAGLQDQFGEILVPTESVVELKSGAKKKTERKFFPGYILIEMEMNDDTWQLVKHTPRVSTFVGGKKWGGEWENNKLNGYALQYNKDGSIYQEGIFKNDKFLYTQKKTD